MFRATGLAAYVSARVFICATGLAAYVSARVFICATGLAAYLSAFCRAGGVDADARPPYIATQENGGRGATSARFFATIRPVPEGDLRR
jgi:predicted benzoate:H+ symporter BenE